MCKCLYYCGIIAKLPLNNIIFRPHDPKIDNLKDIEKGVKEKFQWRWLTELDCNDDYFEAYVRKIDQPAAGSSSDSHPVEGPSQPSPVDLTSRNEDMDSGNIEGKTMPKQEGSGGVDAQAQSIAELDPEQSSTAQPSGASRPVEGSPPILLNENSSNEDMGSGKIEGKTTSMAEGSGQENLISLAQAESIPEWEPDEQNSALRTNLHHTSSEDSREHQKMAPRPKRTLHQEALRTRMKRSRKRVKPYVCRICHTVIWGTFERYRLHIQLHLTCNFGSRKKPVKDCAEMELGTTSRAKMSTEDRKSGSGEFEAAAKVDPNPMETCSSAEKNMETVENDVQDSQKDDKTIKPMKIKTEADEDEIVNVPIASIYRCGKCDAGFNTVTELVLHVERCTGLSVGSQSVMNSKAKSKSPKKKKKKKHKTDRLHKCVACKKTFKDVESLAHHISKKHDGKVKSDAYKCAVCKKSFKDEGTLEHHVKKKHGETQGHFPCKLCGKIFSRQSSINRHMPMHRALYNCERCKKQFMQKTQIRMHKCPTPCRFCGKMFSNAFVVKTHERYVHAEKKNFKCPHCDKTYALASHLNEHMKGTHGLATYLCDQCGKSFSHKRSYRRHVESHAGIKPFTCDVCGMNFVQASGLKKHTIVKHTELEKVPCEFCGSKLKTMEYYKQHVKKYHGDGARSYKCHVCSDEFPNKEALANHVANEKCKSKRPDLVCKICSKKCPKPSHLARHMRVHTGERPFVCTICGKAYSQNYILLTHMKLHDDPKPYTCEVCGQGYGSQSYLKHHVNKFHKGQKDPDVPRDWSWCAPCKRGFKKEKYLKLHMKRKHPDMVEQLLPTPQGASANEAVKKKSKVDKASSTTRVEMKIPAPKIVQDMPQNLVVRQMPQNLVAQEVPQNLVVYPNGPGTSESLNRVPIPLALHSSAPLQASVGVPVQLQVQDQQHREGQQQQKPDEAGRNVIEESMRLITVNWW